MRTIMVCICAYSLVVLAVQDEPVEPRPEQTERVWTDRESAGWFTMATAGELIPPTLPNRWQAVRVHLAEGRIDEAARLLETMQTEPLTVQWRETVARGRAEVALRLGAVAASGVVLRTRPIVLSLCAAIVMLGLLALWRKYPGGKHRAARLLRRATTITDASCADQVVAYAKRALNILERVKDDAEAIELRNKAREVIRHPPRDRQAEIRKCLALEPNENGVILAILGHETSTSQEYELCVQWLEEHAGHTSRRQTELWTNVVAWLAAKLTYDVSGGRENAVWRAALARRAAAVSSDVRLWLCTAENARSVDEHDNAESAYHSALDSQLTAEQHEQTIIGLARLSLERNGPSEAARFLQAELKRTGDKPVFRRWLGIAIGRAVSTGQVKDRGRAANTAIRYLSDSPVAEGAQH